MRPCSAAQPCSGARNRPIWSRRRPSSAASSSPGASACGAADDSQLSRCWRSVSQYQSADSSASACQRRSDSPSTVSTPLASASKAEGAPSRSSRSWRTASRQRCGSRSSEKRRSVLRTWRRCRPSTCTGSSTAGTSSARPAMASSGAASGQRSHSAAAMAAATSAEADGSSQRSVAARRPGSWKDPRGPRCRGPGVARAGVCSYPTTVLLRADLSCAGLEFPPVGVADAGKRTASVSLFCARLPIGNDPQVACARRRVGRLRPAAGRCGRWRSLRPAAE